MEDELLCESFRNKIKSFLLENNRWEYHSFVMTHLSFNGVKGDTMDCINTQTSLWRLEDVYESLMIILELIENGEMEFPNVSNWKEIWRARYKKKKALEVDKIMMKMYPVDSDISTIQKIIQKAGIVQATMIIPTKYGYEIHDIKGHLMTLSHNQTSVKIDEMGQKELPREVDDKLYEHLIPPFGNWGPDAYVGCKKVSIGELELLKNKYKIGQEK